MGYVTEMKNHGYFDDRMIHGIGGTMVGVGEVWHTIATLIIYQRRMGAQMGKGRENNGF